MLEARIHKLSQDILGFAVDAWNRCLESDSATERSPLGIPKELSCELQELLTNLREDAEGSVQSGIRNASPNPNTKVASAEHVREGLRPSPTEEELPLLLWASQALAQIEKLGAHRKELAPLKHSLHRTISLLSSCRSVRGAIEASSTRQAYELAYGLTHEINNPLGNIVARAQQLLTKATDDHARKSLATIVDQAMRAHEMLAEVMRAVQPRSVVRSPHDIVALTKGIFETMRPLGEAKKINWEWRSNVSAALAEIEPEGIQEVLRLVAQNGLDACRPGDTILWKLEVIDSVEEPVLSKRRLRKLRIVIEDTGPGLENAQAVRAFDLYYSGREAGRGLGVSLAVVKRYVAENLGAVRIVSQKGLGCSVEMEFPIYDQDASEDDNGTKQHQPKRWMI